jgi:RNA polymerase sigma factor (sigma-70 family)
MDEARAVPEDGRLEPEQIVAIHEALERLEALDPRQSQIVELRVFGGATIRETAEFLRISESTVKREWETARAWLFRELT